MQALLLFFAFLLSLFPFVTLVPFTISKKRRTASVRMIVHKDSKEERILPLVDALSTLRLYNDDYLERMKKGRKEGKLPSVVELEKAQILKSEGLNDERDSLRRALLAVVNSSQEVVLGIMAPSGSRAISCLQKWVPTLALPRGVVRCFDEDGKDIDSSKLLGKPVYVKYNSSDNGDCCMKPYAGDYSGVIFQPTLTDKEFRQYGDLPLNLFK